MSQKVRFLKGQKENLSKQPLRPGAIYFTEDERRLYIDTDTARLPIAGDYVTGVIFWVRLLGGETHWNGEQKTQTVKEFYENQDKIDIVVHSLSDILTKNSILFTGKTIYKNSDPTIPQPTIIMSDSDASSITFQLYSLDGITVPQQEVWVQLYCPNPNTPGYVPLDVIKTVFTKRIYLREENWNQSNDQTYFYQLISFENIDFTQMPYLITLSDDSMENKIDFSKLKIIEPKELDIYGIFNDSDINSEENFLKKNELMIRSDVKIDYDIAVDFCIVLAKGKIYNEDNPYVEDNDELYNNDWVKITISPKTITEGSFTEKAILSPVVPDDNRYFLVYCTNSNDDNFKKIKDIKYSNNTFTFILKDEFKQQEVLIENEFTCIIIQLNNIATLYNYILNKDNWQKREKIREDGTFYELYTQYIPSANSPLNDIHMPIIYPKDKKQSSLFSKIIETKIYTINEQTRIQFFTKEPLEQDLEIVIVDFK